MRPRARLSFAIAAVLIGVMLTGIAIHPARAYIHWRSSTTSLSQISVYTEALLYNSGTTYLAYPPGTGCCPDLQVLSSTDLVNWATLTTVSGALSHGGMMGLTYNPSDQRMYMTWQRTGISEAQNTPYGPILVDIPMIVVSSSSDGKTWTKPTNITLDGDQYLPQGGNLVLNGPTIIYDPVNNRLLVEYADYFPSCGCQEVFLNETYGPVFGQTWTPLSTSPVSYASSPLNVAFTPDLKSINGRLYMSYTSYSDKSIHVIQSTDGITWTNKADISGQTGYYAVINYNPVEATFHLLWVGTDSKYTINEVTSLDAVSWGGQIIFDGSGSQAVAETEDPPSLAFASNMNVLVMAFTGTDGNNAIFGCPCNFGHLNILPEVGASDSAVFLSVGGSSLLQTTTTTSSFQETQGTYIEQKNPTCVCYGASVSITESATTQYNSQEDQFASFLGFSLNLPANSVISSAKLGLTVAGVKYNVCYGAGGGNCDIYLSVITSSWDQTKVNWNNQPSTSCCDSSSIFFVQNQRYTFDETSLVKQAYTAGQFYGFELAPAIGNPQDDYYVDFFSQPAGGSVTPVLTVTYSYNPTTATMCAGQQVPVTVTMKNTGSTTWQPPSSDSANPFRLGSQNPQDNTFWGNTITIPQIGLTTSRIDLTSSVSPNQQYTFSFTITAPMTPGTYNFQMQMVQELVTWFGDKTPNVQVTVNACPLSASSNPGTVPADGQTSSTITVQTPTNRANVPISLTTNLGSLSSSTCTTGTGGSCSVTITSTSGGTATITASSTGYLSATTTVAFTAITLSASPSSVPADSTTTSILTAQLSNNAQGVTISFTATGGTLSTTSCSTGSTGSCSVTISASSVGTFTVTASSQSYASGQTTVTFFDFTISSQFTSITENAGYSSFSTITIAANSGFSGVVNLSVSSSPSTGLTCSLTQNSVTGSGTSILGCSGSAGSYSVTVKGTSGTLSHSVGIQYTVWDFAISASPTSVTGVASVAATSTVSSSGLGEFSGTITLTSSVLNSPPGFTCNLNPTSVGAGGSSTLSCSGAIGSYTVTVTGSMGSCSTADTCNKVTHSINISFQIQDFSISSPSSTVPVLVGQTGTATLTIASLNGFTGTVSLSDTPLPSGLTCNPISPISITLPPSPASATLSCSATSVGTYTVTTLASSGSLSHTATVTFTVQDYTISISPTSETIIGSNTGASTVTITPVNGFTNIVSLTASPSPSGLYCYFSPNTITGSGTATMSCYGSAGTYTVTITGAVGSFTHFATATITVRDFSISASPSSIGIPDGRSGSLTVQATSLNGYTGAIVLGVSNLYCGTQSFSKPSLQLTSGGSNTSILTLNIGSNCNAYQYNAYVTGYDSSAQVSRAGSLIVNTSDFSIIGQIGTTVGIGGQTTLKYNVTYYDNNNYPGSILTQTNSFGVNNCCLSTTIPTTFSITRADSNSAPGLVTSLNIQTQSFSDPWNGQGFYAQGRDWIFFIYYGTCSGTTTNCLYYGTSTNGAAWTIYNTGLVTGSTPSIVTNGTAVFYVRYNGVDTQSGKTLMLGVGNLHTDGTIAWQPEKTVKPATSGVFWYAMSMRVSTTGQVFVAYNKLTSAYGAGYPYVIHSNGVDYTTWQQDTSLINSNDDWRFSIVPLSNGQMYILYWPYWGGLNGRLWSSGAWGSQETITPSNTYVQQTAFGFSNGNSTVYAIWQERTSQKIQFATRTSSWSAPQTIFTADTGSNPRWTASYDPLHAKWYVLYYSYSTNQIWEYSGQPGSWSGKTVLYTTTGASSNTMIGSFYNSGQVNSSTNTLGIFWTQYDSSLTTLQLKYANATIFTGGSFPSTWPIASTGAGSGATTLTVTASDGYITRSLTLQLTINGYNVTYYYNPLPVNQGSSTAIYLQIFPEYGIPLTQATVSPVTVPSCITVSPPNPQFFNIGPIGGYDFPTVPVAASSTCTVGNYQVTVKINGASVHTYDKLLTFTVAVTSPPPSGGGGGSVAAGTLITLADGSQVPVQSLKVGMQLLSYDMTTHQYVITTITKFTTVATFNQMEIHTATGKPLIVDQNPAQKVYVKLPDGTVTLMSVTDLKVGYDLFDATSQTWTPITGIHYQNGGTHTMYDIYTTSPGNYIANGYLDPLKT